MGRTVHPPNRWPAGQTDLPLVIITPAQRTGYNITFSRSYSQVLPSPYETDCHNYRYSRNQEIDRCSLDKILEWIGVAPPWLTVPTNSAFKTFRRAVYTKEEFAPFNEVAKKCFNTFPQPDCITEEFKPQLTAAQFEFNNGSFDVDINLPTSLDVENYMKPARTKIDLFIYIVNLLGFWFGIHVAALFSVTKKVRGVKKLRHTLLEKMNIPMESSQ